MTSLQQFEQHGWLKFPYDAALATWAEAARIAGLRAAQDPRHAHWWQCGGTWFVGVDVLDNDTEGRVGDVALSGDLTQGLSDLFGVLPPLHPAQVSIVKPGYPKPLDGETEAGFGYRLRRDAAHVDGLRLNRETGARFCEEYHHFILGIPLNAADAAASPMVFWDGSHHIMQAALADALAAHPAGRWHEIDITEPYKAARRHVFETCERVVLTAKPGEAYVIHRHLLHGVAPWGEGAFAAPEGRVIAYFRPDMSGGITDWVTF